jgi:hypothetical protein
MTCERCGRDADRLTISFFDTSMVCPDCEYREKAHPLYGQARAAEEERKQREARERKERAAQLRAEADALEAGAAGDQE